MDEPKKPSKRGGKRVPGPGKRLGRPIKDPSGERAESQTYTWPASWHKRVQALVEIWERERDEPP